MSFHGRTIDLILGYLVSGDVSKLEEARDSITDEMEKPSFLPFRLKLNATVAELTETIEAKNALTIDPSDYEVDAWGRADLAEGKTIRVTASDSEPNSCFACIITKIIGDHNLATLTCLILAPVIN